MRIRPVLFLAPVLVLGLANATYGQLSKVPPTLKPQTLKVFDPNAPPVGPSMTKDMTQFFSMALAGTTTVGQVEVWGAIAGGGFTTLTGPQSAVYVKVFTSGGDGKTLPAGRYRVRFNFSNVSQAMPIGLLPVHAGASPTCNLVQKGGYQNIQTCDVWFTSAGESFQARAIHNGTFGQLTLHSVQVFKET